MKKLLLATTAVFLSTAAFSADVSPVFKAPQILPQQELFSGWWVGGGLGYGWGTANPDPAGIPSFSNSGFVAGGQVVVRTQVAPRWYLGLETSLQWADIHGTIAPAKGVSAAFSTRWYGTTDGQLGFAVLPNVLVYGTGGVAYGDNRATLTAGKFSASASENAVGWTIGGGVEVALAPYGLNNWSAGLDYKHIDLGKSSYCAVFGPGICVGVKGTDTNDVVLARLSYRL